MGLEINPKKSKWWYGRIEVNGRKIKRNLGVELQGQIPPRLSQVGDIVFEKSRARAQAALERFQLDAKKRCKAEELIQTIHEIRTGERVRSVLLTDIVARWKELPRRRPLSERYVTQAESRVNEFAGMEREPVTVQELEAARTRLRRELLDSLKADHKRFLLGLVAGDPPWEAMKCRHLAELPAIQWKLQNLARLKKSNAAKFQAQTDELRQRLES